MYPISQCHCHHWGPIPYVHILFAVLGSNTPGKLSCALLTLLKLYACVGVPLQRCLLHPDWWLPEPSCLQPGWPSYLLGLWYHAGLLLQRHALNCSPTLTGLTKQPLKPPLGIWFPMSAHSPTHYALRLSFPHIAWALSGNVTPTDVTLWDKHFAFSDWVPHLLNSSLLSPIYWLWTLLLFFFQQGKGRKKKEKEENKGKKTFKEAK